MRTEVFFSATCPQNKLILRTAYPFSAGSKQGPGSGGTPFRPLLAASTPAPPIVSCVLAARELVSDGPLPLPESGGGHVLRSQSLPALPGGKLLFLLDAKVNKKQDALKEAGSAGNAQADEGIMENRFLVAASQPDDKRKEAADNQADNNLYNQEGPLVFIQFHFG